MAKVKKNSVYMNNPNLPSRGAEFEYTPEMITEIKKCEDNILHFAENYFNILNMDEGRQKIKLYPAQKRILKGMKNNRFFVLLASRQVGKCVKGNTEIKIRNKNTGEIKEISISEFYSSLV